MAKGPSARFVVALFVQGIHITTSILVHGGPNYANDRFIEQYFGKQRSPTMPAGGTYAATNSSAHASIHRGQDTSCATDGTEYQSELISFSSCSGDSGSVTGTNWAQGVYIHIATIPVGTVDLIVEFSADADLDMSIFEGSQCIIGYSCTFSSQGHHSYKNMDFHFTGDDRSAPVTETLTFDTPTTVQLNLTVKAFRFIPSGHVTFSYSGIQPCSETSSTCSPCNEYSLCSEGLSPQCDGSATVNCVGSTSATGDPHLQNVHGERFDLMSPGEHVLINIPRGERAENTWLRVQADARRLGGECEDIYFAGVNVTGAWAFAKQAGGYTFSAQSAPRDKATWIALGAVGLKVVHAQTENHIQYLNVYVKHLGRAGVAVGGLLGEDDHSDMSAPPAGCQKRLGLDRTRAQLYSRGLLPVSTAQGTFA